jgi:two-component system response regulator PilR (NtrC family)
LAERREDLPILADQLLSRLSAEAAIVRPRLSDEAVQFFLTYPFPGNVRELENLLERAVVLDQDGVIDLADLRPPEHSGSHAALPQEGTLDDQLAELEKARILEALSATGGNRTEAARRLGITFRSLRYRMDRLGLG